MQFPAKKWDIDIINRKVRKPIHIEKRILENDYFSTNQVLGRKKSVNNMGKTNKTD